MKTSELDFVYPPELVATEPSKASRVMLVNVKGEPSEISLEEVIGLFDPGDLLVLNDTRVLPRRIFAQDQREILFLESDESGLKWQVLFPSRDLKVGDCLKLPDDVELTLIQKGRPQWVQVTQKLDENFFAKHGDLPVPPYIQQARGERKNKEQEAQWYQTAWAEKPGSFAAPTASLHFNKTHLEQLTQCGVIIKKITLHVGLGTFLPVVVDDLNEHKMHSEWAHVPAEVIKSLHQAREQKKRIWALGTTVTRTLESLETGHLTQQPDGSFSGWTDLMIKPGHSWKWVDVLMTNFHQPQSTLLALVAAFSDLQKVKSCYTWAIDKKFRLFSYGDLSLWIKK